MQEAENPDAPETVAAAAARWGKDDENVIKELAKPNTARNTANAVKVYQSWQWDVHRDKTPIEALPQNVRRQRVTQAALQVSFSFLCLSFRNARSNFVLDTLCQQQCCVFHSVFTPLLLVQIRKQKNRVRRQTWHDCFAKAEAAAGKPTDTTQDEAAQPGLGEYYHRKSLLNMMRGWQRHVNAHLVKELRRTGEPPYDKMDLWHDYQYAQFRDNLDSHLNK